MVEPLGAVPGDLWLSFTCHSCKRMIFVARVPPEFQNDDGVLKFVDEAQPVRCPYCSDMSEYRPDEATLYRVEQSH